MTLHRHRPNDARDCAWCGGLADPTTGILGRLYPGAATCRACGRRALFCTCKRAGA